MGELEGTPAARSDPRRVRTYLVDVVVPAFEELAEELQDQGRDVEVEHGDRRASLRVLHEGQEEFFFEVKVHPYRKRDFLFPAIVLKDREDITYRAEAHLRDRPLRCDVTELTREELLELVVREYERHLKWHL